MKKFIHYLTLPLLFIMGISFTVQASTQTVAKDTVRFSTDNVVMEDDPNHGTYCFSLYSLDGQWKVQLLYHSDSMFGTFGNDDFQLSGEGRYYNYARNPKNDMVFYSFTDMQVTVSDEVTSYHIDANCLANNQTRFLIEGTIPVLAPTDTITSNLGYSSVVSNSFFGTYTFRASNEEFTLEYGIVSPRLDGTFYTADLLKPELYDMRTGQSIEVISAQAQHTYVGDTLQMSLDVISQDLVLYHLTMYNAKRDIPVVAEEDILILNDVYLQDLTQMYGCYQLSGQNADYTVAISFTPESVDSGQTTWTINDIFMPYTAIVRNIDESRVEIYDINVQYVSEENGDLYFKADVLSLQGVLYHIRMMLRSSALPTPKEIVNIDFGHVSVIDYSKGLGIIGLGGVAPGQYQIRAYFYATSLEGNYNTQDMLLDLCDVMVVRGTSYAFHDAMMVNASFQLDEDGNNHVTIDMFGIDSVLYHASMYIAPLQSLQDSEYILDDDMMVGILEQTSGSTSLYTVQFQNITDVYDDDFNIVGDGHAFSFNFIHEGQGIAGEYGYSAGTLNEEEPHTIFEHGAEIRITPVAGTFSLQPIQTFIFQDEEFIYNTVIYNAQFQFVGTNGVIYEGEGNNFLLCIDNEGDFIELSEPALSSLRSQLAEQGFSIRKILRDGKILLENNGQTIDILGREH